MPAAFPAMFKSGLDWDLLGEQEPGLDNRRLYLPRGKMLGGSGSINAMIYIRGNRADYDEWEADGAEGWGYDGVLPYFKRAEDNDRGEDLFHGVGGPLSVSDGRALTPLTDALIDAVVGAGHERNPDFNGARQEGVGRFQVTQRDGMRCSPAVAYLHPAMERPNLTVIPNALVHRVVFEGTRAVGVAAAQLGEVTEHRAEREVILCGGTYNSPQLLMLSGVGPAEHLTMREVEVLLDQPAVGENLSDHPATYSVWTTPEPESLLLALEPAALEEFEASQTGPFASNLAESGGFARVGGDAPAPDVQFHAAALQIVEEGLGDPEAHGAWVSPCLLTPKSRGSVRLASNDPTARPVIRNRFYSDPGDMPRMVEALRLTEEICAGPAMRPYAVERYNAPEGDSDEALRAHAARTTFAIYHPVGTCAIGSVLDTELRVNGLEGIRVVDASVMPTVPRGNTNAPTIAIAERASDLIRGEAPLRAGAGAEQPAGAK
jgi:choline dehydrogenase